jgi:hypothetical protein
MFQSLSFPWPPGNICKTLLRAIGLKIIATSLTTPKKPGKSPPYFQDQGEEQKVILQRSLVTALTQCAVHLVPMTALTGLIWINYSNLYIGPTFVQDPQMDTIFLAGIQMAAKIQELLCVGSLTTIVLQALRNELVDAGIPLGLLGSGIWYSSLSSFWSKEFWGALRWSLTGYKRLRFLFLLVLAGATVTVVGPASAVLMLPRSQSIPAGGTSFQLDGTIAQYWPDVVTSGSEPEFCSLPDAKNHAICPSGGYESIRRNLATMKYSIPCPRTGQNFAPECQAKGAEGNRKWNNFLIQSTQNMVPSVLNSFQLQDNERVAAIQPHAASIIKMQQVVRDWNTAAVTTKRRSLRQFQWTYDIETLGLTTNPWVRVRCTDAQNLSGTATEARFPSMYWRNNSFPDHVYRDSTGFSGYGRSSSISNLDRSPSSDIRTQWNVLSKDDFGDNHSGQTTTGLLIEMPWEGQSRIALGCSVAAAWHKSLLRSVRSTTYDAWSISLSSYDYGNYGDSPDSFQSNQPTELDVSWLQLLSIPSARPDNVTKRRNILDDLLVESRLGEVIADYRGRPQRVWSSSLGRCEYAMMDTSMTDTELWNDSSCDKGDKRYFIELLLASMVVDGLSRFGSHRTFKTSLDTRDWQIQDLHAYNSSRLLSSLPGPKLLSFENPSVWLEVYVKGYAYYPSSTSDYLALAVVCLYILIAGSHVIAVLLLPHHLVTSDTWDSLTELLVLCQNSPPPSTGLLKNASAGVDNLRTYGTIVKIRATKREHLNREACESDNHEGRELDGGDVILVVEEANPLPVGDTMSDHVSSSRPESCYDGSSDLALLEVTRRTSVSTSSSREGLRQRTGFDGQLEKVKIGYRYG